MQMEMFSACTETDLFTRRLFSRPPVKVLDLGAGIGANTLPMAKSGAHVTAIDHSKELLQVFAKRSVTVGCPAKNLRLRRGDITTMESYEGPFNLVVAVDVLPLLEYSGFTVIELEARPEGGFRFKAEKIPVADIPH